MVRRRAFPIAAPEGLLFAMNLGTAAVRIIANSAVKTTPLRIRSIPLLSAEFPRKNPPMRTQTLYRPVGQAELELIEASGWKSFPPRLAIQPIFYPVLDLDYARQIARDWNTKDAASGHAGYVTEFEVRAELVDRYEVQTVGARNHRELWVPAEELEEFNAGIVGEIRVIERY